MKKTTPLRSTKAAANPPIRYIWMVSREYDGLAGAGGVKDVCRQLAESFARAGAQVRVVLPLYGFMDPVKLGFTLQPGHFAVDMHYVGKERREEVALWHQSAEAVDIYLVDSPRFREKGGVYTHTVAEEKENPFHQRGTGHFDYFAMNVLLQKAAIACIIKSGDRPEIIHCHDGHTALIPAMIREIEGFRHYFDTTACVVTIHNAGLGYHQEVDDLPFARALTGLPQIVLYDHLLNGRFDPLLAAGTYAVLNTVSENYARELRETSHDELTGWLGHRLVARGLILEGITNGINPADYDPKKGAAIGLAAPFDPFTGEFSGKQQCRRALIALLAENHSHGAGLPHLVQTGTLRDQPEEPLFTFVGRLTSQKGVDKLVEALETLLLLDPLFQVLILGSGTSEIENSLVRLAAHPDNRDRVCILRGYDQDLAQQAYAAGDFFLVPSQFEPCGLTDFIAQLFGNLPVVRHTGGLVKVKNGETGFAYSEHSSAALMGTMQKAITVFRSDPERITRMRRDAVRLIRDHYTWDKVIERYILLYQEARNKLLPTP